MKTKFLEKNLLAFTLLAPRPEFYTVILKYIKISNYFSSNKYTYIFFS